MQQDFTPEGRDPQLWNIAQRRAAFKRHLGTYLIMSVFFWVIWFLSGNAHYERGGSLPWPVWPMLGWGIGLLFHYFGAYHATGVNDVEKEYNKLQQNRNNQ